jgi:hypothetical protein
MAQGRKVLAATLAPAEKLPWMEDEWRRISSDLACSPDLSEARVLLEMVRGLPPLGALGLLQLPRLGHWCWG